MQWICFALIIRYCFNLKSNNKFFNKVQEESRQEEGGGGEEEGNNEGVGKEQTPPIEPQVINTVQKVHSTICTRYRMYTPCKYILCEIIIWFGR